MFYGAKGAGETVYSVEILVSLVFLVIGLSVLSIYSLRSFYCKTLHAYVITAGVTSPTFCSSYFLTGVVLLFSL